MVFNRNCHEGDGLFSELFDSLFGNKVRVNKITHWGGIKAILLFDFVSSGKPDQGKLNGGFRDEAPSPKLVLNVFLQLFTLTIVESLFVRLKDVIS